MNNNSDFTEKILQELNMEIVVTLGYTDYLFADLEHALSFAKMGYLSAEKETKAVITINITGGED